MRRFLPWVFGAFVLLAAMITVNTYYAVSGGLRLEGMNSGDYFMQLVKWPALVWSALILVVGAVFWAQRVEAAETARAAEHAEATRQQAETEQIAADAARRTLSVQLVGAQLVTPYISRGVPLQAQLPALLAHNPLKKPKPYYAPASGGRRHFKYMVMQYILKLTTPFETPFWVQRPKGGYPGTSFFYNGLKWTTHKGMADGQTRPETDNQIPVFVNLPVVFEAHGEPPILAADGSLREPLTLPPDDRNYTKNYHAMRDAFTPLEEINFDLAGDLWSFIGNKRFGHHPIFYRFGGGAAGFRSLSAAFDYLEAHPTEVVWLMAIDSPNYGPDGKDEQPNEAGILLMLAHRDFDTGREPLAMIHRPQQTPEAPGSRPLTRLKAALSEALARGGVSPDQVGRYFHDAAGGKALGLAAQAATETLPGFDWEKQNYSLPAWLGDMGATTTPYHLLLAAWAANTEGKPMLVANVVGGEDAVLVTPPEHYTPVDTHQPYWAARSENDFSRPWWGKRKDGKPDVGMSPMNKDDGTPADPEPPFELGY
jgi:hypothetical protein